MSKSPFIVLPPPPQVKSPDKRKMGKTKIEIAEKKRQEAIANIVTVSEDKNVNIKLSDSDISIDKLKDIQQKAKEILHGKKENVIFEPNEGPQTEFLASSEKEVFYGGARGGGKSYALIVDPLRYCNKESHRALFIRRTMPELRDIIFHTHRIYPKAYPGAKFTEQDKVWRFPSGARIEFGYCEHPTDVLRYQGQAYSWIGIDELPQFPDRQILNDLRGSLRTVDPTLPTFLRACVDEGDVLTSFGWRDIRVIRPGDYVWSMNDEGKAELKKVTDAFVYDIDEDIVRIDHKGVYMSMTKDHKIVSWRRGTKKPKRIAWNDIKSKSVDIVRQADFNLPKGIEFAPFNLEINTYLWLLGLFLTEGCATTRNRVTITQIKEPNKSIVREFLTKTNKNWLEYANGDFSLTDKEWHEFFSIFGKAKDKFIPPYILNCGNKEQLEILFDALMFGDGSWQSEKAGQFYTTSERLKDDVSEIGLKLGYRVKQHTRIRPEYSEKPQYEVFFNKPAEIVHRLELDKQKPEYVRYTGKVYCIAVEDNHNFFIKQKGFVWLSSNTGNPGGVGSAWIKEDFIDPAPHGQAFEVKFKLPDGSEKIITRKYIPSKVWNNPYLLHNDDYVAMLASLPETKRRQWLEGDWDAWDGAAFPEFHRDTHVVKPFEIPRTWIKFRSADYGYSSPGCVLWMAVDFDGNIYVYRELYAKGLNGEEFAKLVLYGEKDEIIRYGILDSSVWAKRGDVGPSIAETMIRLGCNWIPADRSPGSRKASKMQVHQRLAVNPRTKKPSVFIFENCTNLIRTLPMLPIDENDPEDVDTKAEDHAYDAFRYGLASRPVKPNAIYDMFGSRISELQERNRAPADSTFGY